MKKKIYTILMISFLTTLTISCTKQNIETKSNTNLLLKTILI